jgi:hypothetical protein
VKFRKFEKVCDDLLPSAPFPFSGNIRVCCPFCKEEIFEVPGCVLLDSEPDRDLISGRLSTFFIKSLTETYSKIHPYNKIQKDLFKAIQSHRCKDTKE